MSPLLRATHLQKDPNAGAESGNWPSYEEEEKNPKDCKTRVCSHVVAVFLFVV